MLKLLKDLKKREMLSIFIIFLLVITQVWLELRMPEYMSQITRLVQTQGSDINEVWQKGIYMVSCAFASLFVAIITGYFTSKVSANFSLRLRKKIFTKVEDLSIQEVNSFSTSSLITRSTNDVTQIQMLMAMGIQLVIKSPVMALLAILKIIDKSWEWSAMTGVAVVILLSLGAVLVSIVVPRFKRVQKLIDKLNGITRENLNGIRVVRAFNAEEYQENKFEDANSELTGIQLFNQRAFAAMNPVMSFVMYGLTLFIYYSGAYFISRSTMAGKLTIFSNMIVFSTYAMQVIMSFLMLGMIYMMYPRAKVSINRINEVLDQEISVKSGNMKKDISKEIGTIEFKNVSFKYPDAEENLLSNISFKANKGDTIAFIGATGSGKTTLINLIPRLYDATEGEVLVDGINVKEYSDEILHNKIGYVPQNTFLFNGSVSYNISFGDNGKGKITDKKIKEAVKVAQAKEFVEKMDDKYDSIIARGGTNISGGQKQRLSIARAIARDPEIFIFDDSFSALDYKTDSLLREELKKYTKNVTNLIVSQRIGTIMHADTIIVLDKGKIVGNGKHKDLLDNCPLYKQIALSQLTEEELANA